MGQMPHACIPCAADNGGMATKRAATKAQAATMVDLEERLAPFFPVPDPGVRDQEDSEAEHKVA